MFKLNCNKVSLNITEREILTSDARKIFMIQFNFNEDWDGFVKKVVFNRGKPDENTRGVPKILDDTNVCEIPSQVLDEPGQAVYVGVYGVGQNGEVMPTIWVNLGTVRLGARDGGEELPPSPDAYAQIIAIMNDTKDIAERVRDDANDGVFDGYTPQKGVDYWTAGDKSEMVSDTMKALQPTFKELSNADLTEKNERSEADENLTAMITGETTARETAISDVMTAIGTETTAREEGYSDIITEINGVKAIISTKANSADIYTKTETDTAITTAIANVDHLKRVIVDTLPEIGDEHTIYMILADSDSKDNKYIEWMYLNGVWEKTGDTTVDLADYPTRDEVNKSLEDKSDINHVHEQYAITKEVNDRLAEKSDVKHTHEDYALKENFNKVIDDITVYSTVPTRIGTWVDGTPIWRIGFDVPVSDGEVSVDIPMCYTDKNIKVIDCDCFSTGGTLSGTYNRRTDISFADGALNIAYTNNVGDTSVYGYVEFVTGEYNVRPASVADAFTQYKQEDGTYKLTGADLNGIYIAVPENLIGSEAVQFSVKVKAAEEQYVDVAYGDGNQTILQTMTADAEFDELTLSNVGYPATADSWFRIRCHEAEDKYVILKDIEIGVVQ